MINFRYHLVSLTAIFLALGLGIAMGASLVDQALVTQLEDQLQRVGTRADEVAATNEHLDEELAAWDTFAEQAGDRLLAGRLAGVPVVLVTFAGVDGDVVGRLEAALRSAGANIPARALFTGRFALADESATSELASLVAAGSTDEDEVGAEAARRVAEAWAGRARPDLISDLIAADFLEVSVEGGGPAPAIEQLGARFVVVSSAESDMPNGEVAVPLVRAMGELSLPVVAADVTRADRDPVAEKDGDEPAPFVAPLRAEETLRARISTVDHAAGFRGRAAIVMAVVELGEARAGQYGRAPGAERFLPD